MSRKQARKRPLGYNRKISTTVYLDRIQIDQMREITERDGVPMAVIIRRAIDRELEARRARR
jgi:hypothetical protein